MINTKLLRVLLNLSEVGYAGEREQPKPSYFEAGKMGDSCLYQFRDDMEQTKSIAGHFTDLLKTAVLKYLHFIYKKLGISSYFRHIFCKSLSEQILFLL